MDKELLKKILRESTLSEAKPVGLALTDKVKGEDKKENDAYYKEVEKKMSDYEKASTSSSPDAIEEPKFNYDYEDEVEYHEDMEIRNGMEMLNYDRKPSEKFSQRAKEAIEGSSNMGNNPEWANVYPEQQGFTGPGFGKELAKTIKGSKEKRDAASELSNKNTTSVNATDFKDSAMTKRPKSIAISEDVSKTVVQEIGKKLEDVPCPNCGNPKTRKTYDGQWCNMCHNEFDVKPKTTNNKSEIKESTKMKRLKFKKPFNGIETALKVIPESYKVDNKVFEMTDGNENYKIRWEGSLTEGKAVVLTAYDKTLVKEDMDKIKHLMGFKSQETLGNLKGKQRIEENNIFADMLKKTRTLMTEGGKYDDGDDEDERCDYVPCDENPVSEAISWEQIMDGDKIKQLQVVPSRSFNSPEELENATMTIIGKLDDNKVKLKGNKDGKEYHFDIADLRSVDDPANRVNFS
jgi:ribosomal protein L37AE/L43A